VRSLHGSPGHDVAVLPVRQMGFEFDGSVSLYWNRSMPELSAAANSISLLMPYVEPLIARTVRERLPELEEPLRAQTAAFARQELAHNAQHRRFNDVLAAECPGVRRVERWIDRTYGWIERKRSPAFRVAFAAASETIAFAIARWAENHATTIFDGAEPEAVRLFTWHLAEEVEHKSAAFDVFDATGGRRPRYALAATLSLLILMWFTFVGSVVMLRRYKRMRLPVTWFRLTRWSVSLAFTLLPTLAVSCLPGHHPRDLPDPVYLAQWLRGVPAPGRHDDGADADDAVPADHAEDEAVARVVDVAEVEPGTGDGERDGDGDEPGRTGPEPPALLGDDLDDGR
jgi:predicted metal-dependent hydrolase